MLLYLRTKSLLFGDKGMFLGKLKFYIFFIISSLICAPCFGSQEVTEQSIFQDLLLATTVVANSVRVANGIRGSYKVCIASDNNHYYDNWEYAEDIAKELALTYVIDRGLKALSSKCFDTLVLNGHGYSQEVIAKSVGSDFFGVGIVTAGIALPILLTLLAIDSLEDRSIKAINNKYQEDLKIIDKAQNNNIVDENFRNFIKKEMKKLCLKVRIKEESIHNAYAPIKNLTGFIGVSFSVLAFFSFTGGCLYYFDYSKWLQKTL